jgi:hypothetical protein
LHSHGRKAAFRPYQVVIRSSEVGEWHRLDELQLAIEGQIHDTVAVNIDLQAVWELSVSDNITA